MRNIHQDQRGPGLEMVAHGKMVGILPVVKEGVASQTEE